MSEMSFDKIKNSKRIMVLSVLDDKYYELQNENNHFSNYEIEFPINWITYENRYIAQDPYLKDSLFIIIKILE